MNCLTYYCCPWKQESDFLSKTLSLEESSLLDKGFFSGNLDADEVSNIFKGVFFLPDGVTRTVQLIYLTGLADMAGCSPLTEEQERVFDISRRTDEVAHRCLKCGCVVSTAAGCLALGSVGPGCFGPSWILQTIGLVGSSIGSGVSYLATGCYPHIASVKANEMQNTFSQTKDLYLELGSHLIRIYEDYPARAKALAQKLDTQLMAQRVACLLSADEAGDLVKPLEKAVAFVLSGTIPDAPLAIRNSVELLLLRKKIETQ